ncbi:DNA-3-methyladenine glycosylase [Alteribacter lacisalsi]|uniref:DNA-3-methyladenine glycosylase II n=1 Tax=Alteribacter lacisalsi TaxID=2045244 RepID=A0A2W0H7E3_9BACI|nr:DNA-3-methyladenine glycosylase [Alteribacter lacisalsi]PYZ96901.1 DNA-3-methyladenine glycosylase [Alteribacter lacisalsi]
MQKTISLKGPYNFDQALVRLAPDPWTDPDPETRTLRLGILSGEKPAAVTIKATGSTEKPEFTIVSDDYTENEQTLMQNVAAVMQFDVPLGKIAAHLSENGLKETVNQSFAVPFIRDAQLFGSLIKTIIHQQLNMTFAAVLTNRFVRGYGEEKDGLWFFPSPESVSRIEPEELREMQFSQRKAEYVIDTARWIIEEGIRLEEFTHLTDAEIEALLTKRRGIGRWTAENFMMFGLGRPNLFPVGDIGVQNALKKEYGLDQKPDVPFMEEASAKWAPYRSYATLYLWNSLGNGPS